MSIYITFCCRHWNDKILDDHLQPSTRIKCNEPNDKPRQNIKKQTSLKVRLVKAMDFPVVMYGCDSWAIKKAECQRIDAFEPRHWRRLFRVPWTARRSNQSILKDISPEHSLEGLKLKLQYFGHLMLTTDSLEKTPMLEKS